MEICCDSDIHVGSELQCTWQLSIMKSQRSKDIDEVI